MSGGGTGSLSLFVWWDRPIRDKNASPDATVSHDLIHPHCSRGESIAMKSHGDVSRILKGERKRMDGQLLGVMRTFLSSARRPGCG